MRVSSVAEERTEVAAEAVAVPAPVPHHVAERDPVPQGATSVVAAHPGAHLARGVNALALAQAAAIKRARVLQAC